LTEAEKQFVYYPADWAHTLETTSEEPAHYMMFKWYAPEMKTGAHLEYKSFQIFGSSNTKEVKEGFQPKLMFEGQTAYLRKFHCHTSTLTPGAGYEPHKDDYDVIMVVLEGEVETLGQRVGPYGAIFYAAGEPHGIRNPGDVVASYIVFEFHGYKIGIFKRLHRFLRKVKNPQRWKRKIKKILK
ncbi:MAG: hypothetical protein KAR05_12150, partial [Candidatus Omnitrophica bacterium]|nr:hypothetical protein [Candidatus Omnitrophota bacterium]